jgi:large subunit ribosomal protein L31e
MAEETKKPVEKEKKDEPKVEEKVEKPKKEGPKKDVKTETPKDEGKEYVIPLREKCRVVPRYKKTNKAVRTVKEFLARHMKVRDRDLNKVKLDSYLNEFLWARGIKNPPHKVKVRAIKEGEIVRAELVDLPKKLANKKARAERLEKSAKEVVKKKKAEEKKEEKPEEKKEEEKEKKAAVVEAGAEMEKAQHKQAKHTAKGSAKAPAVQRKALSR